MTENVSSRGKLMVLKALGTLPPVRRSTRKRKCHQQLDFEFTPLYTSTPHKRRLVHYSIFILHCLVAINFKYCKPIKWL